MIFDFIMGGVGVRERKDIIYTVALGNPICVKQCLLHLPHVTCCLNIAFVWQPQKPVGTLL